MVKQFPKEPTSMDVAMSISMVFAQNVLSAKVNGRKCKGSDLSIKTPLQLLPGMTPTVQKQLLAFVVAHLMVEALESLYPG